MNVPAEDPPPVARKLKHWGSRAAEPHVLFPAVAGLVLALIWGLTLSLINRERDAAEYAAAISAEELSRTYEAQVLRAVREIDQTLKLIQYVHATGKRDGVLAALGDSALLLPELVFVTSIADRNGAIVESNGAMNVASQDFFRGQHEADELRVGLPQQAAGSGDWVLQFSRPLKATDGSFAGIAMVSVDAAYFVSGYDTRKLGERGLLGILGTDGVFRARRSGEAVFAGDKTDLALFQQGQSGRANGNGEAGGNGGARLMLHPWDGIGRYTSTAQLFNYPLTVMVGLAEDEQLAQANRNRTNYLLRAFGSSILLIAILAVLARMSRELALSRQKVIDEKMAHAALIEHLAYHDSLTRLPNRSLFSKLLSQSMAQAQRYNKRLALLFIDLDHFKQVNDTLGHEAGDELLKEVAHRLTASLRESDTVARIGGDEFVVLLPEMTDDQYGVTVARKILASLDRPVTLAGVERRITASIGISVYPEDGLDEQTLTRHADDAMYQAKQGGRNTFQMYDEKTANAAPA